MSRIPLENLEILDIPKVLEILEILEIRRISRNKKNVLNHKNSKNVTCSHDFYYFCQLVKNSKENTGTPQSARATRARSSPSIPIALPKATSTCPVALPICIAHGTFTQVDPVHRPLK